MKYSNKLREMISLAKNIDRELKMPVAKEKSRKLIRYAFSTALCLGVAGGTSFAAVPNIKVQCPGDTNGDAIVDVPTIEHPNAVCMHLTGGDGFATMADGNVLYTFSFSDVTGIPQEQVMMEGMLNAQLPAPPIALDEGDEFYLTLTNVGMAMRPDLFDPHTVHFHGFPEAAPIFDGVPDSSISINMGASLTYYYNLTGNEHAGTYLYHCHVEATEHMAMGMLGSLHVRPAQNRLPDGTVLGSHVHSNPDWNATRRLDDPLNGDKYVYNDGDGSTRYDVEYSLLLESFDRDFHEKHIAIQALPFAGLKDDYTMINGRGYPDTISNAPMPAPAIDPGDVAMVPGAPKPAQKVGSLITATKPQKLLLRIANVNINRFNTVGTTGLPMKVVGKDSKLLRGPTGKDLSFRTTALTLGGGQTYDVIIDTATVPAGEYYFYTTNFDELKNDKDRFGGMMTKIIIQ